MGLKLAVLEVFESDLGGVPIFFWQLRARNGEIMCVSEAYNTSSDAKRGARRAKQLIAAAEVVSCN